MRRRNAIVRLKVHTAEALLRPVIGSIRVNSLQLLTGGLSNSNYLAKLTDGTELVIRIWTSGENHRHCERVALKEVKNNVAVPTLLHSDKRSELGFAVGIFEKLPGDSLWMLLRACDESQARRVGRVVGETLAELHRQPVHREIPRFSTHTALEYIRSAFDNPNLTESIGSRRRNAIHSMLTENENWLVDIGGPPKLAHGDFKGDNILVCQSRGHWQVGGVIDWEWVHAGTTFSDVATLLRNDRTFTSPFTQGFTDAYDQSGGWLPRGWKLATRLFDLVNQSERLSWSNYRPALFRQALSYVDATIREFKSDRPKRLIS